MKFIKCNIIVSLLLYTSTVTATIIKVPQDQPTIQAGIDSAIKGDTVLVDTGRYVEHINFNGKSIVVGSQFLMTGDTSYISQTVLDGGCCGDNLWVGSIVTFVNGEDSTAVLKGLTISNAVASAGGGIYCVSSNPSLEDLIIVDNWVTGIQDMNLTLFSGTNTGTTSNPVVFPTPRHTKAMASKTELVGGGGGIYCENSSPTIRNVTLISNDADMGGGICCYRNSNPRLINIRILRNNGNPFGGGVYCEDNSNPILINVIISENGAAAGAGIYCIEKSSPILMNVTVSGNMAAVGSGIFCRNNSNPLMVNTIIWTDWNDLLEEVYFDSRDSSNSITIAYSDVQGGSEGITTNNNGTVNWLEGNIESDPLFTDPDNGDFGLQQESPAIDAGTVFFVWDEDTIVNLSDTSYQGSAPDIGAFESPYRINYFPLNIGDERQYYSVDFLGEDTSLTPIYGVTDTAVLHDKVYFLYENLIYYTDTYVRVDTIGNVYMYYDREDHQEGETILFNFNVAEGDTYRTKSVFLGQYYLIINIVNRNDTVYSRAGNFSNCIQFWIQGPGIDADLWYWVAPNVGIVAIAGDWEPFSPLYYAQISETVYPTSPLAISSDRFTGLLEYRLEAN